MVHSQRLLATRLEVSRLTIQKWQARQDAVDPRIGLTPYRHLDTAPGRCGLGVTDALLLPLDVFLAVTREWITMVMSRSGLLRCLKRHGIFNLMALIPVEEEATSPIKRFQTYDPWSIQVDVKRLPQMADHTKPRYLFAAIDRATRWVSLDVHPRRTAKIARAFLSRLLKKAPFIIQKVLTDNVQEFTDQVCERQPFDQLCRAQSID